MSDNNFTKGRDMVCKNCDAEYYDRMSCHWCPPCRMFHKRNGYERPPHYWDPDFVFYCGKCNVILEGSKKWVNKSHHDVKDVRCKACYKQHLAEKNAAAKALKEAEKAVEELKM